MASRKNQAAINTSKIIEVVAEEGPIGLTEITEYVDLTIGTVHTYVHALLQEGLLQNDGKQYKLSSKFIIYGDMMRHRTPIYTEGKDQVDKLVAETGETALIMIEYEGRECILYESFGDNAIAQDYYERNIGEPQPLYCTASGKAVLAFVDEERREELIESYELESRTSNTITNENVLREELAAIRSEGIAYNNEEQLEGLRAVAAPIQLGDEIIGAISLGGPKSRVEGERFNSTFPELVSESANLIEVEIRASNV
jgi:DNA-binding IclR family transcriptional regulator